MKPTDIKPSTIQTQDNNSKNKSKVRQKISSQKQPEKPTSFQVKVSKNKHTKNGSYIWILDKNRKLKSIPSPVPMNASSIHNRQVSLTNSHNFLWMTTVLHGSISFATKESELNKASFDRMLNLLPKKYRIKIWNIINPDNDTFIVSEDFIEFIDCLLIATGQKYEIKEDIDMEIRDMSRIFCKIVDINSIFKNKKYTTNSVSKSKIALAVKGAKKIIINLRNFNEDECKIDIQNDLALPILTGLTQKALIHSVTYCTQIYWKILTNIFWNEDDDQDLAICTPIDHFNSVVRSTSMQDLFGELHCELTYDLSQINESVEEEVEENTLDINKYLTV